MKITHALFVSKIVAFMLLVNSCSKEVKIDIPGFKEQLVVDGTIETGMPPIVILSKTKDIYAPTNINDIISGYITDARVFVSNGTIEEELTLICANDLPPGTEEFLGQFLGMDPSEVMGLNICAYTSMNTALWGEVGKTYSLRIEYEGKVYTSSTQILPPQSLVDLWFEQETSKPNWGYAHAKLADTPGVFDAYKWESKRINMVEGHTKDPYFKPTFNSVVNDDFFDGTTFDFYYENPWNMRDTTIDTEYRGLYTIGDTVVIRFSKIDKPTFDFFYSKTMQSMSSGNPFASPINVKTNIVGGAFGVWAGISPIYDTMICQ